MTTPYVSPFTNDPEYARLYAEQSLCAEIGEALATLMQARGVSKARLAVRLGVSLKRIRRLLRDGDDVKLFAAAVHELGGSVRLTVVGEPRRTNTLTERALALLDGINDTGVKTLIKRLRSGERWGSVGMDFGDLAPGLRDSPSALNDRLDALWCAVKAEKESDWTARAERLVAQCESEVSR